MVRHTSTEVVDAENEYMAAVIVADRLGNGAEIANVRRANGRTASNGQGNGAAGTKKRRTLSPEARANLAANLVKARAARAAKARARKRAAKATKKTAKRTAKKR
jgi:hypothetical protein